MKLLSWLRLWRTPSWDVPLTRAHDHPSIAVARHSEVWRRQVRV